LLNCGYKNIAYVGGLKDARSCIMRYKGYIQVLKKSEQGFDKNRVAFGEFTLDSGYNQARTLMEKDPTIDAFFANSDFIALGILKYLRENNYSVPEQIGLIGFDNIQFSDYPDINLTTIKQPIYNIGKNAFNLLLDQMNGGPSHRVIYQPELIIRGTTSKR